MMDKLSGHDQEDEQTNMPPGFRFHPTDEELITHYLSKKVVDDNFVAKAIAEVDMNKTEPWELPWMAKLGGKEWYFFCVRDKKYPTGLRTNRATASGYWKATGKDKEIFRRRLLIGMKKTLVFYMGRAPKGEKTNWVIHEYRLAGKSSMSNLPASSKNEWVISRVFYKTSGGKKVNISELIKMDSGGVATSLPPLTESPVTLGFKINNQNIPESVHVPCFSNAMESNSNIMFEVQSDPTMHQFPLGSRFPMCDQAILRGLIGEYGHGHGHGHGLKMETEVFTGSGSEDTGVNIEKGTSGIEDQEAPSTSGGPFDLDCLWNY